MDQSSSSSPYSPSSSSTESSSQFSSPSPTQSSSSSSTKLVLSIECLKGSTKADEWTGGTLQTGDIVEELRIGNMTVRSPFKNGKSGVQRLLHASYKQKETSIAVRVRRGGGGGSDVGDMVRLSACIVPAADEQFNVFGKKQYFLRAIDDPNYAVGFVDRTENECLSLQASRSSRMVHALERTPLQDGYVSYPWEKRMHEMLSVPNSSSFYSILFLPKSSDRVGTRYNDLEDTLARAHAWINSSQAIGVPVVFMNIQTESLLTKISGETASATVSAGTLQDLSNLASSSLYGFEDYHGVDIGVVRAVRMWFSPVAGEIPIEIRIKDTDAKLGFAISRTEEGFIHISSVAEGDEDVPSARSGIFHLLKQATASSRLLIVSRISNRKVLPWMVSPTGAIRCFDTVSLSRKLSLHRHARIPILMHVFLWDRNANYANVGSIRARAMSTETGMTMTSSSNELYRHDDSEDEISEGIEGMRLARDTAGETSFRFHDFALNDNWV